MKRLLTLLFLFAMLCGARAADTTVFAAASLADALEEAAQLYKGGKVVSNFAASSTLARQIAEGARADLFLSADEAQMDRLAQGGHLREGTRRSLLSNTLVIVTPKGAKALSPQALPGVRRLALADPEAVPAGVYAKAYLTKLGLWEAVAPKVVPTANVRAALAAVEAGNMDAGIVYKTDAARSAKVAIAYEVPRAEGPQISYPVALLKDAPNAEGGAAFLKFLESPEGVALFKRHGFLILPSEE